MSQGGARQQLEAFGLDEANKGKFEEEVTIDLNTTQTNQEREYREFIRQEVETEAKNLMNLLSLHCAKLAVGFLVYFVPGNPAPVQNAAVSYFLLSVLEQVHDLNRRLAAKSRSYMRLFLAVVETLCVVGLLAVDSKPGLKLMVPTYLLLAMFNLMMTCLEFSESIDEVFNVKIVRSRQQTTVIPKLLFILQFMLIVLKRSEVVDWNWSSVVSVSFIVVIFCVVGLICLLGLAAVKAAGYFLKKTKGAEGALLSRSRPRALRRALLGRADQLATRGLHLDQRLCCHLRRRLGGPGAARQRPDCCGYTEERVRGPRELRLRLDCAHPELLRRGGARAAASESVVGSER